MKGGIVSWGFMDAVRCLVMLAVTPLKLTADTNVLSADPHISTAIVLFSSHNAAYSTGFMTEKVSLPHSSYHPIVPSPRMEQYLTLTFISLSPLLQSISPYPTV